jgi:hypothetical protein
MDLARLCDPVPSPICAGKIVSEPRTLALPKKAAIGSDSPLSGSFGFLKGFGIMARLARLGLFLSALQVFPQLCGQSLLARIRFATARHAGFSFLCSLPMSCQLFHLASSWTLWQ